MPTFQTLKSIPTVNVIAVPKSSTFLFYFMYYVVVRCDILFTGSPD